MKSWIWGKEYVITPSVVASALGVPKVQQPVYPYNDPPPLDDIMSYLTGTSIQWGTDPRIISHELSFHLAHLSLAHHSYWEMCIFVCPCDKCFYEFSYSFHSILAEVHRSSSTAHGLFFPVFIHWILLHLGLEDFPASEDVHNIALVGATFLQ